MTFARQGFSARRALGLLPLGHGEIATMGLFVRSVWRILDYVGLRQIADWCRLLWTFREEIDVGLLEGRLTAMGLLSEWRAFGAFAVEYLGMPEAAMPLYSGAVKWRRRARRIRDRILYTGNFGHNKDESYRTRYPWLVEKGITFFRRFAEFVRVSAIFPKDAPGFFLTYVWRRVRAVV